MEGHPSQDRVEVLLGAEALKPIELVNTWRVSPQRVGECKE